MAKELPYFKFEPGAWDTGNIQLCDFAAQGVFTNLCSMYWQRLGDMPYKLALQKICKGNATALQSLVDEGVIKVIDGMICIDFLNEQLSEFENTSSINSKNARSGWEKRRNNATALQPHSDPNAIRGEEIIEEKTIEREPQPDFFESEAQAYMLLSGNYHDVDAAKKIIANNGWPTARDVDTKALIHHFLSTQVDIKKQDRADIRSHLRRWLNKQTPDRMREWAKNILENHARRQGSGQGQAVEISGNAGSVPETG